MKGDGREWGGSCQEGHPRRVNTGTETPEVWESPGQTVESRVWHASGKGTRESCQLALLRRVQ